MFAALLLRRAAAVAAASPSIPAAFLRRSASPAAAGGGRFFSNTGSGSSNRDGEPPEYTPPPDVKDVPTRDLKSMINDYFANPSEDALPAITEAIFARGVLRTHEESDDELLDAVRRQPLNDVPDKDVESDFSEAYSTEEDEALPNLYNAPEYVRKKMASDPYFNMDDKKWDEMVKEGIEDGYMMDTRECEAILEDMMQWDKLLPDEVKKKVSKMIDELADMVDRGEIKQDQASELYKDFEDKLVIEYMDLEAKKKVEEEGEEGGECEIATTPRKINIDDPPGEGPILRWESRVVFAPGGDAWHPKNRKVKLAVTVKELELSRFAYRRLREIVGKRYHSGRDELTITSERFEHREENRKDCLRTLYALIEEAWKADKQVDEARKNYLKDRLKANPLFMERLKAKAAEGHGLQANPQYKKKSKKKAKAAKGKGLQAIPP